MFTDLSPIPRILSDLQRVSKWFISIVLAVALLVLAGWEWNIMALLRPLPRSVAMNPMTALVFLLSGISLYLIAFPGVLRYRIVIGRIMASMVLLIGIVRGLSVVPGFSFAIDLILYGGKLEDRMALISALSTVLLACAFLLSSVRKDRRLGISQALALGAGFPALFSITGYLYRVQEFYGIFRHLPMAIHTAVCFFLLSLAFLFARPAEGIMKNFTSGLSGSIHARLFMPIAVFAPLTLGLLRLYGFWAGLFSTEFGITILVLSIIIVFTWAIYYSTILLNKRDLQNHAISADLAASEQQQRLLVDSVQDYAIFMLDNSGYISSWNTGAQKIKGYRTDEVLGRYISIFYTREDSEKGVPRHNLDMAKAYGHYNSEGWRVRKDGTRFWADIVFTAIYDEQRQLRGFVKITRDRTEFKKAQEKIAYQARLMEDASDAIIAIDASFRVVSWNRGAGRLYGFSAGETVGRQLTETIKTTSSLEKQKTVRGILQRQGHWSGEVVHLHRNGAPKHLLLSISETRDMQGKVDGYVVVGRDISERKEEEDRLRKFNELLERQVKAKTAELMVVFERISDGFMALDRMGQLTYVNQKAAEMNKCAPEDLIGKNFWKRFPTATRNEFGENFHRALETLQNIHFEMFSPSLQMWIECYMYPSEDGLSLFFRDISERRKAEETILRSSEELRLLASHLQDVREEERAGIAREIHDELGQQLTGIKMDISWIAKRWNRQPDDPIAQKMGSILGLLDNTIRTVRRIATELRPSILDDLGLIAAIEWQSQEFQRRSGINANFHPFIGEFQFEPSIAIGLFRICQESLTNVARHANARNVWISLDWVEDRLTLVIRDDGKGMDKTTTGDKKTLGLLGMQERALMMGGSLTIHSINGKGLTLEVSVPLKEPIS